MQYTHDDTQPDKSIPSIMRDMVIVYNVANRAQLEIPSGKLTQYIQIISDWGYFQTKIYAENMSNWL